MPLINMDAICQICGRTYGEHFGSFSKCEHPGIPGRRFLSPRLSEWPQGKCTTCMRVFSDHVLYMCKVGTGQPRTEWTGSESIPMLHGAPGGAPIVSRSTEPVHLPRRSVPDWPTMCPACRGPAYQGLNDIMCKFSCQPRYASR